MAIVNARLIPDSENPEKAVTPLLELFADYVQSGSEVGDLVADIRSIWGEFVQEWDGVWLHTSEDRHSKSQIELANDLAVRLREALSKLRISDADQAKRFLPGAKGSAADVLRLAKGSPPA